MCARGNLPDKMAKRGTNANPDVVKESLNETRTRDDIAAAVKAERATLDDEDESENGDGAEDRGASADEDKEELGDPEG